jgi:hypothetical protein
LVAVLALAFEFVVLVELLAIGVQPNIRYAHPTSKNTHPIFFIVSPLSLVEKQEAEGSTATVSSRRLVSPFYLLIDTFYTRFGNGVNSKKAKGRAWKPVLHP